MQRVFAWPYRGILAFLIWTGVRPWQLTLLSLALNVVTGVLIVTGAWLDRLGLDERRPVQRMRDAVAIVRRLHAGDRSGYAGEVFTLAPGCE